MRRRQLNTASAAQQVTLTNAGDAALTLIAAQIASGDFTVVNGCGNSLNGHSTCSLLVAFVPKSVGAGAGALTVTDEFRSQTVTLSGVGVAPAGVSLSPVGTVAFAATGVGLTAAAQTVTLTNNGGVPLAIQSIDGDGGFCNCFGHKYVWGEPGGGRGVYVAQIIFTPTAAGARTGSFTVVDNAALVAAELAVDGDGSGFCAGREWEHDGDDCGGRAGGVSAAADVRRRACRGRLRLRARRCRPMRRAW